MSATYVEKLVPDFAATLKSSVGLRFAAGLVPAILLMGVWGDFARSVTFGDEVTPIIEAAASTAARLPAQSRDAVAGDLAAMLGTRKELRNVQVETVSSPAGAVTIHVTADVQSRFTPFLARTFSFERSASAPAVFPNY